MTTIKTSDGTELYYKDWGTGQPVVFSHGWPLSADAWEDQMVFLGAHGYRCIAHDRRGHGRSSQPWNGNDMDTYADDLATLVQTLDLKKAIHIGHSTGGGEVARYIGRHGTKRVAKAVLIGAVPPLMLKTAANPGGLPMEAFDGIRAGVLADRSQFFKDRPEGLGSTTRRGGRVSSRGRVRVAPTVSSAMCQEQAVSSTPCRPLRTTVASGRDFKVATGQPRTSLSCAVLHRRRCTTRAGRRT